MVNLTQYEDQLFTQGYNKIAGVDECGIGTLAGPVVAAAVILDPSKIPSLLALKLPSIKDSKKLSKQSRAKLFPKILESCLEHAFGWVYPNEINEIKNIQQCGYLARFRALSQLNADYILCDHFDVPEMKIPSLGITKGDNKSLSIACASILGKVTRDTYMTSLAGVFPHYGWDVNFGYDVPLHRTAIETYGVTEHHKLYYAPIQEILNNKV
jgi:ribonuclease HII